MHTGDLATMDDEGHVKILGRLKDMRIRGRENIYPREIEEFIHSHPEVGEAQVIGIPRARDGKEAMAWIRLRPGATLTAYALHDHCKGKSASFKIPATGSSSPSSR